MTSFHLVCCQGQPDAHQSQAEEEEESDEISSDNGEHTTEVLKKLNFPETEKEPQPTAVVSKVAVAIQKRVKKLSEGITKLEGLSSRDDVQAK